MTPEQCAALKSQLDASLGRLDTMRANSGIRSIRDSDGSGIEYSIAGLASEEQNARRLAATYCACCDPHYGRSGPIDFIYRR